MCKKDFKGILVFTLFLFGLSCGQVLMAQSTSQKEESIDDINKKKALLNAKKGLKTLQREVEVGEDPCTLFDSKQWYTAFNSKSGIKGDPKLANTLLAVCQQQLKMKVKGRYQAVIRDYFDQMDVNSASIETSHIEGAGDYIIDQFLNDTEEYCRLTSDPDEETGRIIMYMSIRVNKKELVDKLATGLSQDKELKVRFNEEKFREKAMKVFQEDGDSKNAAWDEIEER